MDWKVITTTRDKPNTLVVWYMIYQYLRHVRAQKILSDRCYRMVRNNLLLNWDEITHMYLNILDKQDVEAHIKYSDSEASYPKSLVTCANLYLKEFKRREKL